MRRHEEVLKYAAALIALLTATEAFARGGAANLMIWPSRQRRLQESRGMHPTARGAETASSPVVAVGRCPITETALAHLLWSTGAIPLNANHPRQRMI